MEKARGRMEDGIRGRSDIRGDEDIIVVKYQTGVK
jgi:hypothetical protein